MKLFFTAGLLLAFCLVQAQTPIRQIEIYKSFGSVRFEMDSMNLTHRQVSDILSVDPAAHIMFKQADKNNTFAGILGFAGALMVAVPLVTAGFGGQPEWSLAVGGGVLLLGSIPFARAYKYKAGVAIESFNLHQRSGMSRLKPRLGFTRRGLALVFTI